MSYRLFLGLLLVTLTLAVSCATPLALPTLVPTPLPPAATAQAPPATPQPPTATAVPPTAIPLPTATTEPTATDVPPSPVPTATEVPATVQAVATASKEGGGEHDWEVTAEPWTVVPPGTTAAAVTPTAEADSDGGGPLDAVIPPARGRELLYNNCTSCHSVVCALIGQRTEGNWNTVRLGHSDRVPGLGEADQDILYAYLIEHFSDQQPEPDLPPELREQGCSAQ